MPEAAAGILCMLYRSRARIEWKGEGVRPNWMCTKLTFSIYLGPAMCIYTNPDQVRAQGGV